MSSSGPPDRENEEFWRDYLTRGDSMERRVRGIFRLIPQGPRCKLCAAPFAGIGAPLMRMIGKRPSAKDDAICNSCFAFIESHHGGAEIECSFLFADIRGSTAMAEGMSSGEFHALLNRFYATASKSEASIAIRSHAASSCSRLSGSARTSIRSPSPSVTVASGCAARL